MQFEVDRSKDVWGEPSLTEMTETALKILQKSDEGYFLLVEGKREKMNYIHNRSKKGHIVLGVVNMFLSCIYI